MRKNLFTLFVLSALSFIPSSVMATDYTVEPTTAIKSNTVPMFINSASVYGSITQQIFLPSEMKDADENTPSAGDITKITFYYAVKDGKSAASAISRDIEIWLMEIDDDIDAYQYDNTSAYGSLYKSKFFFNANKKAGVKVYDGKLNTNAITLGDGKQSLPLEITPFAWDGESNIVLTLFDKSSSSSQIGTDAYDNLRFYITETTGGRFVHWRWTGSATDDRNTWMNNLDQYGDTYSNPTNTAEAQANTHRYVSLTTFTITPSAAPTVPSTPEDLAASNIGSTSASLSWSAVDGATSYDLYNSTSIDGVYSKFASPTTNSYDWSGLTASTTYFVKVAAVNGAGSSDLSEPISFTTLAPHIHDGITFEPWSNPSAMPTSGNYYLANDVAYDFYAGGFLDLAGDLNLCLNGHTIDLGTKSINVTNGKTMTLYDPVGGGKITGFVPGQDGIYTFQGVISVENNGTLVIREGEVENTYPDDNPEYKSIAIAVGGTLILSGAPGISSNEMDIYLPPTIPAKVITIEPGKPLTNTTPYRVYKESGVLTSGWANMSGADPKDYFVSANLGKSICLSEGEAALQTLLTLSETALNSAINSNDGQIVDVNLTRPLVASQYNTLCLPFALDNTQLEEYFGAGYDLEELTSTSLEDDMLNLTFNKVTALVAGKPYLLKPADDVSSVMFFDDVTIVKTLSNTVTSYVDFKGVYGTTSLEGGNRNLLFLGAGNELFYPSTTANIKAFRAYFEVKGAAQKAAKRARIVKKEDAATGMDQITNDKLPMTNKILRNGEILILRDGKTYNVLGMECK